MNDRAIELHAALPIPAALGRESMIRVLKSMGDGSAGEPTSLTLFLRDLHARVIGEVAIPVHLSIEEREKRWECALDIRASSDEGFFPTFTGTLSVSAVGYHSELWLIGEYRPPFGAIGAALDSTVLRNSAQRSLQAFLAHVRNAILDDIRASERGCREARGMHN